MPSRIIREGILTSEGVNSLNWAEEVFYRRLLSVVDDFGRYYASPKLLRAACYPLHIDKVSDSDIGKWLSACETAALVRVYPAKDGKRYVEVQRFNQQVRAKESKFPHPPSTCVADAKQTKTDVHLDVSVFGGVSEGVGVAQPAAATPAPSKAKRKTAMPEGFGISDRVRAWATEHGFGQLEQHLDAFKRKADAKGYTYVNWDAAFMEAIREDWAKLRGSSRTGIAPPGETVMDPDSRAAIESEGEAKGLGRWNELNEPWSAYKARVRGQAKPAFASNIAALVATGLRKEAA